MKAAIIKALKNLYSMVYPSYSKSVLNSKGNILVSYITKPFYNKRNTKYLNGHQNRRETLWIADVLENLKYSYKFIRLDNPTSKLTGYDIVFGVEPNFVRACEANPNALKIYYATGAYYKHQDAMVISRTDEFNKKHKANISYSRRPIPNESSEIADIIFQIGSSFTISTYPDYLRSKIKLIRQSCHTFTFENFLNKKLSSYKKNNFIWMGSGGSILKGLDIVLDYFIKHKELNLHIIGPIDRDVLSYYDSIIQECCNINRYGFIDLDSPLMEMLALNSAFTIMLSGSEGCPGAVINMMKLGCIPIVSKYSAFDGIEEVGTIVTSISEDALNNAVNSYLAMEDKLIEGAITQAYKVANNTFNKENFIHDINEAFLDIISTRLNP